MEKLTKSWSTLTIKSIDDDKRIITGIASTPSTDRDGDIIEPEGAKFALPYPLLAGHNHNTPIGEVISSKVTSKGIEITANIVKDSGLAYVDEAWMKIKAGLMKGLSIGFRAKEYAFMDNGGIHFKEYEIMELSTVTIPANQDATITSIKHYCGLDCKNDSAELDIKRAATIKRADVLMAKNKLILRNT